jgi:hypothetical protein
VIWTQATGNGIQEGKYLVQARDGNMCRPRGTTAGGFIGKKRTDCLNAMPAVRWRKLRPALATGPAQTRAQPVPHLPRQDPVSPLTSEHEKLQSAKKAQQDINN